LLPALEDQLDISAITTLPTLVVFENSSWIPAQAQLTGPTAAASRSAGEEAVVRADLTDSSPLFVGADQLTVSTDEVVEGVINLAIPFDDRWTVTVGGTRLDPRRSFGDVTGFDVARDGPAELTYSTPTSRSLLVMLQTLLWMMALALVSGIRWRVDRHRMVPIDDETLIDLRALDPLAGDVEPAVGPAEEPAEKPAEEPAEELVE
jgi:hypothetical protein